MMRGVSPIISTVIMVAIAIAAAVVVFQWTSGLVTTSQGAAEEQLGQIQNTQMVLIDSIAHAINGVKRELTVTFRNPSETTVTLEAANTRFYIYDNGGTYLCEVNSSFWTPTSLTIDSYALAQMTLEIDSNINQTGGPCDAVTTGNTYILRMIYQGASIEKTFTT